MSAKFIQEGDSIDYTPGSAKVSGDVVVQTDLVGVVVRDIPANTLGALAIKGVFEMPKRPADVIPAGDTLYWNTASAVAVQLAASGTLLGKATLAAGNTDTVVSVRLDQ